MYTPTQNGTETSARSVRYAEAAPPHELRELAYCFWQLKTGTALPGPAGVTIDVVWQVK